MYTERFYSRIPIITIFKMGGSIILVGDSHDRVFLCSGLCCCPRTPTYSCTTSFPKSDGWHMASIATDFEKIRVISRKLLDFSTEGSKRMRGTVLTNVLVKMLYGRIIYRKQDFQSPRVKHEWQ